MISLLTDVKRCSDSPSHKIVPQFLQYRTIMLLSKVFHSNHSNTYSRNGISKEHYERNHGHGTLYCCDCMSGYLFDFDVLYIREDHDHPLAPSLGLHHNWRNEWQHQPE